MPWKQLSNGSWPNFDQRQKTWTGFRRHFRQHHGRSDRPTIWEIWVQGDRVFTRHGLLDGAMQETSYVGKTKNAGKANEITAEQDALAEARRDARKKWDFEGFDEYVDNQNIDCRHQNISIQSLLTNLPGSFVLYKPENNMLDQKKLMEKARKGEVLYTLKRDGMAMWIVVDYYGNVQMYSRRSRPYADMEEPEELPDGTLDWSKAIPWGARFPHLIAAVQALELPPGTMMAVELVARDGDNFPYISGLTKGYTQRALEDQQEHGLPMIYWWDIPFFNGEDLLKTESAKHRFALMEQLMMQADKGICWEHIQTIQKCTFASPEEAIAHAKELGLEGWVVMDPDAVYGDKGWNLKGKPDRPSICAKLKPKYEDDFIAVFDPDNGEGEWGTGKHERGKTVELPNGKKVVHGGIGAVSLYQKNKSNELVYICKCASGMDYEFQAQLKPSDFPMVWQVEYTERTYKSEGDKTDALRFPTFLRARDDKKTTECINERL